MKIRLNSKEIEVQNGLTVEKLKNELALPTSGIAIAVNGKIVLAGEQAEFHINENDDVIIIGAAYGG